MDASKVFHKVLHNGLFVKLLKKNESSVFLCAYWKVGIVNSVLVFFGMVLLVPLLLSNVAYVKVEFCLAYCLPLILMI